MPLNGLSEFFVVLKNCDLVVLVVEDGERNII
jgi:hypothetical protein